MFNLKLKFKKKLWDKTETWKKNSVNISKCIQILSRGSINTENNTRRNSYYIVTTVAIVTGYYVYYKLLTMFRYIGSFVVGLRSKY